MIELASAPAEALSDEQIEHELRETALRSAGDFQLELAEFGTGGSARSEKPHAQIDASAPVSFLRVPALHNAQAENRARRWMWGFLIALAALQSFYVQEMLAALFLFSLVFVVFAVIALAIYAVNHASEASLVRAEPYARVAARAGRRTFTFIEQLSRKPFRRPHSETAP